MIFKKFLLFFLITCSVKAGELPMRFINAIHQVESGGRIGAIKGDSGLALGPLQIHYVCWLDATEYDKSIGGKYKDCADLKYSIKIFKAYLNRYGKKFILKKDYESLARIWNGGPQGYKKSSTKAYWNKVKKHL